MTEPVVLFDLDHAKSVLECWQNAVRELDGWLIVAAIMVNHFHFVAVLRGKVIKAKILQIFKG